MVLLFLSANKVMQQLGKRIASSVKMLAIVVTTVGLMGEVVANED